MKRLRALLPQALALTFALGGGAAGCSLLAPKKDPTRFYELTAAETAGKAPAASPTARPPLLLAVEVDGYLQNPSLAERVTPNRIAYLPFDQWAEPLGEGLTQVLKQSLANHTGHSVLEAREHYIVRDAIRLNLRLERCDLLPERRVQFKATWTLQALPNGPVHTGSFDETRPYPDTAPTLQGAVAVWSELATALSQTLGQAVMSK
jgi:uncharacterized lipoprotein YmbA